MNSTLNQIAKTGRPLLVAALLAVVLIACTIRANDLKETDNAGPAPSPRTPVDGVIIKPGTLADEWEVNGTLIANQQVEIVSELTRKIVTANVSEGSHVRKGTLLFKLDDSDLQARLERLRLEEKLASLNEQRLKDLIEHDAIALQDYDEAVTNLKVLQAQIRELQVTIEKTRITAPFDGQIGMINIHPGAIVSVNTVLTDIEDNSLVKVEFSLPEKYIDQVRVGSELHFTTPSSRQTHSAKVAALAAKMSDNTRTLLVRAVTPNANGKLKPGQSARLKLTLSSAENSITVLSHALIPSSKGYSVYVSQNGVAAVVPVEIGQRGAGEVEIVSGLHAGDTVITSNLLRLSPQTPVSFVTLK